MILQWQLHMSKVYVRWVSQILMPPQKEHQDETSTLILDIVNADNKLFLWTDYCKQMLGAFLCS